MPLSDDQVAILLKLVSNVETDLLDCDGCFERLAEFAEVELEQQDIPEALELVKTHLEQCKCCADEYEALLAGLRSLRSSGH